MKPFKRRFGLGSREVWITGDFSLYSCWVDKYTNNTETEPPPDCQGRCTGSFVWLRTPGDIPTLVHELIHAVDFWMDDIGIGLRESEVRAYAVADLLVAYAKHIGRNL